MTYRFTSVCFTSAALNSACEIMASTRRVSRKRRNSHEEKDAQTPYSSNVAQKILLSDALKFDPVAREPIITGAYKIAQEFGLIVGQTCAVKRKHGNIPRGVEVKVHMIPDKQVKGNEKVMVIDHAGNEALGTCKSLHFIPNQGADQEIPPYAESSNEP